MPVPLVLLLVVCSLSPNVLAATAKDDWQTVIAQRGDVIEINGASIERSGSGATAWSRLVLDQAVAGVDGDYDVIQVQNFYDCAARQIKTLRRVYWHGDTRLHEAPVHRAQADRIQVGSIEARLWQRVCQPAETTLAADDHSPVKNTWSSAAGAQAKPEGAGLVLVADKAPGARLEKPSLIALPQISEEDKAAADQAATSAAQKPRTTSLPAESKRPVAPADSSGQAARLAPRSLPSSLAGKTAPAASTTTTVTAANAASVAPKSATHRAEPQFDKHLRELIYATSGPRSGPRKTPKKLPSKPMVKDLGEDEEKAGAAQLLNWSYDPAGETGPAQWARLNRAYGLCASGKRQTPIDIRDGVKVDLDELLFDYKPALVRVINTGRGIQLNVASGLGVNVSGKRYELRYATFHRPAEMQVAGKVHDMEVQLVHEAGDGQWMVLALLVEAGSEHPVIQSVLNNLPLEQSLEVTPVRPVDVSKLLPDKRTYWTFMGSLNRPPCMEGVLWLVLKQPIQASVEQMAIFSRLSAHNVRPIQPSNGRLIKESR